MNNIKDEIKHKLHETCKRIAVELDTGEYDTKVDFGDSIDSCLAAHYLYSHLDILDLEFTVTSAKTYLGACLSVPVGGAYIEINTRYQSVCGYSNGVRVEHKYYTDALDLDAYLIEQYNCE